MIITQKENKGEYGENGWKWNNETLGPSGAKYDWDIYAHTFDQNGPNGSDGTPYRYLSATSLGNNVCTNNSQTANGKTAYSNIGEQVSCNPSTLNASNWYNYPAATAGSDNNAVKTTTEVLNSICPKGWQLPPNAGDKSYNTLIRTAYSISDTASDATLLANSAMSFVRLGFYNYDYGSLNSRSYDGFYWSSTAHNDTLSRGLYFYSGRLNPQDGHYRAFGMSIRCVSR